MLALPLPLLALAAAAFAIAPNGVALRATARPDQRLLPPTSRASVPAPANHSRFAVARARWSGGERPLLGPRGATQRWRVEP